MPAKSKKVQEKTTSPKSGSPKNKTKRCPKGQVRNPKTGICEKKIEKGENPFEKQKPQKQIEMRENPKNLSKMTIKEKDIYEKRKSCIHNYRNKLPSLMEESEESTKSKEQKKSEEKSPESESLKSKTPSPKNNQKRCPKGEHRNPKTGNCEKKGEKKGEKQNI